MRRRKIQYDIAHHLTVQHPIKVRFNETDALGIVWHGNYLVYFEEGREAFGRAHGITYLDIQAAGYSTPIIQSECNHKLPLKYGDDIVVETSIIQTTAAKIILIFKIFNQHQQLVCEGRTVQVFVDHHGKLTLNNPPFYEEWKAKVGLS